MDRLPIDFSRGERVTEFTTMADFEAALRWTFPDSPVQIDAVVEKLLNGMFCVGDLRSHPLRNVIELVGAESKGLLRTLAQCLRYANELEFEFPEATALTVAGDRPGKRTNFITQMSFEQHHGSFPSPFVATEAVKWLPQPIMDALPTDVSMHVNVRAISRISSVARVFLFTQYQVVHRAHPFDGGAVLVRRLGLGLGVESGLGGGLGLGLELGVG